MPSFDRLSKQKEGTKKKGDKFSDCWIKHLKDDFFFPQILVSHGWRDTVMKPNRKTYCSSKRRLHYMCTVSEMRYVLTPAGLAKSLGPLRGIVE